MTTGIDRLPVVVLISGSGTNLQTFIDGQLDGRLTIDIRAVISSHAGAHGLTRAERAGLNAEVLPSRGFESCEGYDAALLALIERHRPALVILAGFMRILTPAFVSRYEGRLLNIHPSLLPRFRGLHTHRRALEAGVPHHGCSVHYVIPALDAGPIIVQARIPVEPNDTETSLQQKVQAQEHRVYPIAVRWIAEGRVGMRDGEIWMDGDRLQRPVVVEPGDDTDLL